MIYYLPVRPILLTAMNIDITGFSDAYKVRRLEKADISDIYSLCSKNVLYYKYCPPFVTEQSIINDMKALPPGKEANDKYYVGYYDADKLIAVMDLIMACPDEHTAFIGFFMTDVSVQNKGIGSEIIEELCSYLTGIGLSGVRLGWVRGNPQAAYFWKKNHFSELGLSYNTQNYTVMIAQRDL